LRIKEHESNIILPEHDDGDDDDDGDGDDDDDNESNLGFLVNN
jgi:hypothetical protein